MIGARGGLLDDDDIELARTEPAVEVAAEPGGDVEAHFAHYPPGARYVRHRDRFRDDDHRVVSLVVYLNADWDAPRNGGELRLYDTAGNAHDVAPLGGRAACFLSADIEHEVLPATRDRLSVAAWLRRR